MPAAINLQPILLPRSAPLPVALTFTYQLLDSDEDDDDDDVKEGGGGHKLVADRARADAGGDVHLELWRRD